MRLGARAKGVVANMARGLGYEIRRRRKEPEVGAGPHGPVTPTATYSPWNSDEAFLAAYRRVSRQTLVDLYRCWELWCLVEQSRKLGGSLIEVGTWRGGTGALLAMRSAACGIADPVYLCDTFSGMVKASALDPGYVGGEHADTSRSDVEKLLARCGITNARILEGVFPDQTGPLVAHASFRLCHIDVDVYRSAREAAEWLWPRVVVGGLVVFDDYGFDSCAGVTRYVDEQASEPDRIVIHNLNGHAVVVKIC